MGFKFIGEVIMKKIMISILLSFVSGLISFGALLPAAKVASRVVLAEHELVAHDVPLVQEVKAEALAEYVPGSEVSTTTEALQAHLKIAKINEQYQAYIAEEKDETPSGASRPPALLPREQMIVFKDTFLPFYNYMDFALFDEGIGYYSSGAVKFKGLESKKADFATYPMKLSPAFGSMVAYQAYAMWLSMIASGDIEPAEKFNIIEFGAGEGVLAHDVLHSIMHYASQETLQKLPTHWTKFQEVVKYVIGERSASLRIRQNTRNAKFVSGGKLEILDADARDGKRFEERRVKGLVVSNELPDAFPVHKVKQHKNGSTQICVLVPTVHEDLLLKLPSVQQTELQAKHTEYVARYGVIFATLNEGRGIPEKFTVLSGADWRAIKKLQDPKDADADENLVLFESYVDSALFPEVQPYLARHQNYLKKRIKSAQDLFPESGFWYLNNSVQDYIASVAQFLVKGFVITIDYGYGADLHFSQCCGLDASYKAFRTYPEVENIYSMAGTFDMTTDINFADVYMVGKSKGLDLAFYGRQAALADNKIGISAEGALSAFDLGGAPIADSKNKTLLIDIFKKANSFKMIIQKKVSPTNGYAIFGGGESLFPAVRK